MRFFFFFKHKTAYEMRSSDWSSDVCSSDLLSIKGVRDSKTFPTKREAVDWANRRELELRDDRPPGDTHSLRDALRKYAEEVSPHKRGERWEQIRLAAFEGYLLPLDKMMADRSEGRRVRKSVSERVDIGG